MNTHSVAAIGQAVAQSQDATAAAKAQLWRVSTIDRVAG
jgi:hypothetical protein